MVDWTPPPIRLVFADDHPAIRTIIRALLTTDLALKIVGEAASGTHLITLCQQQQPEVVLLDLYMPGPSPVSTVRTILLEEPLTKIIVVSAEDDAVHIRSMTRLPICGYVLKDDVIEHLLTAIHAVVAGATWYSPVLSAILS